MTDMWILKDKRTGRYVADQNKRQGSSFTNNLRYAKVYSSREAAVNDSCQLSEYAVSVEEEMG